MFFLDISHIINKYINFAIAKKNIITYITTIMKRSIFITIFMILSVSLSAQTLKGYYYNEEYQVYLRINADSQNVTVPGQEIYGEMTGYFGSKRDGRLWLITEMERIEKNKIEVSVINDYGSEDFTATLTEDDNQVITMKHKKGSTFKIVVDRKYVKIPKEFKLKWMKD